MEVTQKALKESFSQEQSIPEDELIRSNNDSIVPERIEIADISMGEKS